MLKALCKSPSKYTNNDVYNYSETSRFFENIPTENLNEDLINTDKKLIINKNFITYHDNNQDLPFKPLNSLDKMNTPQKEKNSESMSIRNY